MRDFERQSKVMRHERRYVEKNKKDRSQQIADNTKRSKQAYNLEFDDYRKGKPSSSRREEDYQPRNQSGKRKKLRHIQEEES